jgi:hypothetical protein
VSSLFSRHNIIAGDNNTELTCQMSATSEKTKMMSIATSMITRRVGGKEILFTMVEQKSLSNVNNTHSSAAFMRSDSSSSITFVLLREEKFPMYLLYVAMMAPCPTATTIRMW